MKGARGASRPLEDLLARGERENVEFKEFLSPEVHLSREGKSKGIGKVVRVVN